MDFLVDFQNLSSRDGEKKGVTGVEQDREEQGGRETVSRTGHWRVLASLSNQLLITGLRTSVVGRGG